LLQAGLFLDSVKYAGLISSFLKLKLGGKYVYTNYRQKSPLLKNQEGAKNRG
jgi:hypothetical protein